MSFAGAARSSASSSWARSTSWTSSTSRSRSVAASARAGRVAPRARRPRASDEVVEVERRRLADRGLVRDERPRDRPGAGSAATSSAVTRSSSLSRENARSSRRAARRPTSGSSVAQQLVAIDQRLDRDARVAQDLAARARGTSGPARPPAADPERRERRVEPLGQLLGGSLVERDGRDRLGIRARRRRARRPARRGSSSCRCRPARRTAPARRRGRRGALVGARAGPGGPRRTGATTWRESAQAPSSSPPVVSTGA